MNKLESLGLKFDGHHLLALDQTLLPSEEKWLLADEPAHMISIIKNLQVRGAPLIGVAACLSLARSVEAGASVETFLKSAKEMRAARPTAVNLMKCVDRLTHTVREFGLERAVSEAEAIFHEDVKLCEQIAANGEQVIADGDGVLTHCNTGGLATVGIGTALGVITHAKNSGKKIRVYVDETRPLLQGGRLTTWECQQRGLDYTLICDNMAASLMKSGKVQKVIVGADRIAANGDFANKVGTYGLAVLCKHHSIPFYVAAPYTTVDPDCMNGAGIEVEERKSTEISTWTDKVWNPAFDVTPAELVSGWILDKGLVRGF